MQQIEQEARKGNIGAAQEKLASARAALEQMNSRLLAPEGLELTQVYDETEYINSSMNLVTENVAEGAVLSFIVLLLFLKNVRSSLVIFTAIATSMMIDATTP